VSPGMVAVDVVEQAEELALHRVLSLFPCPCPADPGSFDRQFSDIYC
jgi:hypothetical protein